MEQKQTVSSDFLKTELHTGVTFANLALSAKFTDKRQRNKANARKAYHTALKFIDRLTPDDATEVHGLLEHLRRQLRELGESL